MTAGQNHYLVDRSGLLNRVNPSDLSKFTTDLESEYEQQDHLNKIIELNDANIDYSRAYAGKAGSVVLLTDAANANRAQDLLFGSGRAEPKFQRESSVVPFRMPVTASVDHVSAPFGAAAANDEGRGRAPKIDGVFMDATRGLKTMGLRTFGYENNGIAA